MVRVPLRRLGADQRRLRRAREGAATYVFTLTFSAPRGFVFDPALRRVGRSARKVSDDGARLFYRAIYTTEPPTTTVAGCPTGWVRGPVTLGFTAEPSPEGADVAYTEYSVDGGAWVKGTSVTIKRQGVTVVSYRSADTHDNVEQARTCTVRIDRVAPVVFGWGRPMVRQDKLMRCHYKVTDASSATVTAKLVVKRVHSDKTRSYDRRPARRAPPGDRRRLRPRRRHVGLADQGTRSGRQRGLRSVALPGGLPLRNPEGAAHTGRSLLPFPRPLHFLDKTFAFATGPASSKNCQSGLTSATRSQAAVERVSVTEEAPSLSRCKQRSSSGGIGVRLEAEHAPRTYLSRESVAADRLAGVANTIPEEAGGRTSMRATDLFLIPRRHLSYRTDHKRLTE